MYCFSLTFFGGHFHLFHFLILIAFLQLFDGHNGSAAAIYAKENLLNNVLSVIPPDLNRDEWIAALPRALVAGFVKTDKDFQEKGMDSSFLLVFALSSVNFLFKRELMQTNLNLHVNITKNILYCHLSLRGFSKLEC